MRKILNIILILTVVVELSICLRLHNYRPLHRFAEAPDQLAGLTDA